MFVGLVRFGDIYGGFIVDSILLQNKYKILETLKSFWIKCERYYKISRKSYCIELVTAFLLLGAWYLLIAFILYVGIFCGLYE